MQKSMQKVEIEVIRLLTGKMFEILIEHVYLIK